MLDHSKDRSRRPREMDRWQLLLSSYDQDNPRTLIALDLEEKLRAHPRARELAHAESEGRHVFSELVRRLRVPEKLSSVHEEVFHSVEARALMLSASSHREMVHQTVLLLGTHRLDEEIDPPLCVESRILFRRYCRDIKEFFNEWKELGELGHALADFTQNKESYYRGIQRVLFGGLLAQSRPEESANIIQDF